METTLRQRREKASTNTSFPALPEGYDRERFLTVLRRVADRLPTPVSAPALATFIHMASLSDKRAWTSAAAEPCCYMAQTEIAATRDQQVSPSRVRAHEAELVAAGLIDKRTMGNGARSGFSGRGIYFTPAIARAAEFIALCEAAEAERQAAARLRALRSTHLRHLKSALAELAEIAPGHPHIAAAATAMGQWPSTDALHSMSLEALIRHESEADSLCRQTLEILSDPSDSSGRPHENERSYIQVTTQDPNIETCNASVPNRSEGKPSQVDTLGTSPDGAAHCLEKNDAPSSSQHKSEFLEKLGPQRLFDLASPDMQLHLEIRRIRHGSLVFHDFVIAAQARLPELGINSSAWREAVAVMGEDTATMCVLILDANRDMPGLPVRNPGGYLRGMTRASQAGTLNIIGSLIGLSERRRVGG
jgi:replication initiation protein RepC